MVDSGEFFFFTLDGNGTATTFNADLGRGHHADRAGLGRNLPRIRRAATTEAQYPDVLARFRAKPDPPGALLHWGCRDDERSLDLTEDRLDMTPAGSAIFRNTRRQHEQILKRRQRLERAP